MGGRFAFYANCRFPGRLKAAVGFYGGGISPEGGKDRFGRTPPIGEAHKMKAPILLGYGADDAGIPPSEHARVAEALSSAKNAIPWRSTRVLATHSCAKNAPITRPKPLRKPGPK